MNSQPKRFGTLTWQPDLVLPHRTFVQITPVTNTPKVCIERCVNIFQIQKCFLSDPGLVEDIRGGGGLSG